MKSQIEQILIPTTQRTLGSEKAVKSVAEENGSLKPKPRAKSFTIRPKILGAVLDKP